MVKLVENCIITAINDIRRQMQGLIVISFHICISEEVRLNNFNHDENLVKLLMNVMKLQIEKIL